MIKKNKSIKSSLIHKIRCKIANIKFKFMRWKNIKLGYIDIDGTPLKCFECGSKELEDLNYDYIEHTICEYDCKCKNCGQQLGHWAYGYWSM